MTPRPQPAISTTRLRSTKQRDARIRAACVTDSVTAPWDYTLSAPQNHMKAALALAKKIGLSGSRRWIIGYTPTGYVFVYTRRP